MALYIVPLDLVMLSTRLLPETFQRTNSLVSDHLKYDVDGITHNSNPNLTTQYTTCC